MEQSRGAPERLARSVPGPPGPILRSASSIASCSAFERLRHPVQIRQHEKLGAEAGPALARLRVFGRGKMILPGTLLHRRHELKCFLKKRSSNLETRHTLAYSLSAIAYCRRVSTMRASRFSPACFLQRTCGQT